MLLERQLAAVTQERDQYKKDALVKFDCQVCSGALDAENESLRQQLATVTQERDELQEELRTTMEKVMKEFDKKFFATDRRLDNTRDHRVGAFYAWCREQARKEHT